MKEFLTILAIAFGMVLSLPAAAQLFLSICFSFFYLLLLYSRWRKKKIEFHSIYWQGILLFTVFIYQFLKEKSPCFYFVLTKSAATFAAMVGRLIQKPISMRITYSGLDLFLLFFMAGMCACLLFENKWKKAVLYFLSLLAGWGIYLAVWTVLAENSLRLGLHYLEPLTGPLDYRTLLLLLFLGIYSIWEKQAFSAARFRRQWKRERLLPVCLALGLLLFLGTHSQSPTAGGAAKIVFWDTGIDFQLPDKERYGLNQVGMFGVLPQYLLRKGYACQIVPSLERDSLEGAAVLVVINPMRVPDQEELLRIHQFVEAGGSVLLAGDHTGHEEIRKPINQILQPVEMELNFDSAVPFQSLWGGEYNRRGKITTGISDSQVQMVVGASLNLPVNAAPIVITRGGYSDRGELTNSQDGYLGDMQFNRGEQIGDLILAAQTSYGKGKFLLFGDTSLFQNMVMAYSYPFIDNIFADLSRGDQGKEKEMTEPKNKSAFQADCVIDAHHLEAVFKDKSADAVDGLIVNIMRAGMFPYINEKESLTELCERNKELKLIVLLEPAVALTEAESKALHDFVYSGGHIILCADYKSPAAARSLAAEFGFTFLKIPLGRVAPDKNKKMAFWDACPILYQGKDPKESSEVTSLMEIWSYSVMVSKKMGDGKIYVLADAQFLRNKNLESLETYRQGNVQWLDEVFTEMGKEGRK